MKNNGKDGKHLKLTSAFFYDTDVEPSLINLTDTSVAIGVEGFLSGYHGSFSQTKGFKPIKEIADRINKNYTIIDFIVRIDECCAGDVMSPGALLNLKQMTKLDLTPIYNEICHTAPFLFDRIKAHSGFEKALIDNPHLLNEILPYLGKYKTSVFLHTIKPNASPSLTIASISIDQVNKYVVSASCRFNRDSRIVW